MRRLAERIGSTATDLVLTAALLVIGLLQAVLLPFAAIPVAVLYTVGSTLPLAWRRTYPIVSSLLSTLCWLIPTQGYPFAGFVVVVLQFFALGSRGRPRSAVVAVTAWAVVASAGGTLLGPEPTVSVIGAVLVVVAPVVIGQVVARLHQQNSELTRLADELRTQRRRAEDAAVGAERARIAQELHDVVGHELTLIAIQAEAATAALQQDPARAAVPVRVIKETAHTALVEVRGMLDLLAPGDASTAADEDLAELARRAATAGVANSLEVTGTPAPAASATALAVHRIVRECLTNAGRHGSGPIEIRVTWTAQEVRVRTSNPSADNPTADASVLPGRGLTGLRHRAELLGGQLTYAVADGEFSLEAVLPTSRRER